MVCSGPSRGSPTFGSLSRFTAEKRVTVLTADRLVDSGLERVCFDLSYSRDIHSESTSRVAELYTGDVEVYDIIKLSSHQTERERVDAKFGLRSKPIIYNNGLG